jgi:DNA-binding MarR family transcriptional regulator
MTEPVKVLPMAKLLRLAREKEERERAELESADLSEVVPVGESPIPQQTIPHETIVEPTIIQQTIVPKTIPQQIKVKTVNPVSAEDSYPPEVIEDKAKFTSEAKTKRKDKKAGSPHETIVHKTIVNEARGYYPVYNDISDRVIPELQLNPYEQSVFQRLYRLSRGWKSDECEVGLGTLAKHCVMSRSQVQRSLVKLIEKGLIENLGSTKKGGKEGNRYRVLPNSITSLRQTIPRETIVEEAIPDETIVTQGDTSTCENTVVSQGIVTGSTNKNNNKDLLNTHTQTGVSGGSRFSLEECKRFAEHLQKTGQGINNPGGYATTIFRSGEADPQIEVFVKPPATVESGGCPDCGGSGYYYPEGVEKGVKICKHEKLKGAANR